MAETHSAVVFFYGDRAYKVKKPVDLGFLDFRTREAREEACHREVERNRRFAPDVYLGVADVHGPDGSPIDHLVMMRRMPHDRRLSTLIREDEPSGPAHVWSVARAVAALHAEAPRSSLAEAAASPEAVAANWQSNVEGMASYGDRVVPVAEIERVHISAQRYLAGRGPLLAARLERGLAREGHGDLLSDDIFLLPDGPRILDCLDFDDMLRCGDVLLDAAFLAMDLERLGRPDLGERFLGWWMELLGEAHPRSLAHHYVAYRSLVRAKVSCVRAAQGDRGSEQQARTLMQMCVAHLHAGSVRLVVVGGPPGTGKSTLASDVAEDLGFVTLSSDVIRKQTAGLDPHDHAPAAVGHGIYDEGHTEATYRTMLDRAKTALAGGESVVLDASWTHERWRREAVAVARSTSSDLIELRCDAPPEIVHRRLQLRGAVGSDGSDADLVVAAALAAAADPWPTALPIDTALRREQVAALARSAILGGG